MIIPVRCFTCGKVMGHLWDKYVELILDGVDESVALDRLKLTRYCCRQILISHVDIIERLLDYSVPANVAVPSNNEEEVPINDKDEVIPSNDEDEVPSNIDEEKVPSNDDEEK